MTQAHCEVDAPVSLREVEANGLCLAARLSKLVSLTPNAAIDVWDSIEQVADALDVPARAAELIARLQGRMVDITERCHRLSERPRVACIEWIDPLMAAGNWMPELVEQAGGTSVSFGGGRGSMPMDDVGAAAVAVPIPT